MRATGQVSSTRGWTRATNRLYIRRTSGGGRFWRGRRPVDAESGEVDDDEAPLCGVVPGGRDIQHRGHQGETGSEWR